MNSIAIFNGTIRNNSKTREVSQFVVDVVNERKEMKAELIEMSRFDIQFETEGKLASPPELTKLVDEAKGYIIVAPEYNHGYPGTLKYILDMNMKEYIHKPVGMVGVASGAFGGTRLIEQLVPVVRELGMVSIFTDVNVTNVGSEFVGGKPQDEEKWQRRMTRMLDELEWMMKTLNFGRENIESNYHIK